MILDILIDIEGEIENFFKFTQVEDIGPLLTNIISVSISIAAILLLIYLIWSGIQWLTSGGEKTAVASARDRMTNAFIGLIIVLSAWAIFTLVKYLFGIPSGVDSGNGGWSCSKQFDCCQIMGQLPCCNTPGSKIIFGCVDNEELCDKFSCTPP